MKKQDPARKALGFAILFSINRLATYTNETIPIRIPKS